MNDSELLIAYRRERSRECLEQLVARHVDVVYSAARRQMGDGHVAEDVTQEVFLALAKKAGSIAEGKSVVGWLLTTTRLVCLQMKRAAARRGRHESEAAMAGDAKGEVDLAWGMIAGEIDEAVAALSEREREAIVLRFFAQRSTGEMAAGLAISEEAAKKRVQRALESLRGLLAKRGFGGEATGAGLGAALAMHAVKAAPAGLAGKVAAGVCVQMTTVTLTTKGTLMAAAKMKTVAMVAAAVAIVATAETGVYLGRWALMPAGGSAVVAAVPASARVSEYLSAYALPANVSLASVAHAPEGARAALYQQLASYEFQVKAETPTAMIVQWKGDRPAVMGMAFGGRYSVESVLPTLLDIYPAEVVSAEALPEVEGDLVYRAGATAGEYVAGLQGLLSAAGARVRCVIRKEKREVVVLRGEFQLSPGQVGPAGSTGEGPVYVSTQDPVGVGTEGNVFARAYAGSIMQLIGQPVVVECANFPNKHIGYLDHRGAGGPVGSAGDVEALLQHVTEQTHLKATREVREVRCLVVEKVERVPALAWQGYAKVSPFAGLRWNGESPEVQVDAGGAWYGLESVDGVAVREVVAFAKGADREWERRFEEDFVAMMSLMGHPPLGTAVKLGLKDLGSGTVEVREGVEMTEEKRRGVYGTRHAG